MKYKFPLRRVIAVSVALLVICLIVFVGNMFLYGKPISFGYWSQSGPDKHNVENFVVAGIDDDGYRTDLILFCQYDFDNNSLSAIQIPRDTYINNKRNDKKINSAYGSAGKSETMLNEIESVVGIKADKYVVVSFKGFREIIDAIGGVKMDVPMRMYYTDPHQNLTIDLQPGSQLLDGTHAEMFMRFRQNNDGTGYADGDIGRNAAQKKFYNATLDKLLSKGTVLKIPKLLTIATRNFTTNFSGDEIIKYIGKIPNFSMENVRILSLPGEGRYDKNGISYFYHDKEKTKTLVDEHFKTEKTLLPKSVPTDKKFIRVRLVDATGINQSQANVLKVVSDSLTENGFVVAETETSESVLEKSELINHNSKLSAVEICKLYKNVSIADEIQKLEKTGNKKIADVTLVIGKDFIF